MLTPTGIMKKSLYKQSSFGVKNVETGIIFEFSKKNWKSSDGLVFIPVKIPVFSNFTKKLEFIKFWI